MNLSKYLLVVLISIVWLSCNKDTSKDEVTPTNNTNTEVPGEWLISYEGVDANKNGKLDADERDYTISGSRTYMIFKTGGKATYKFVDDTDPSSNFEVDFT